MIENYLTILEQALDKKNEILDEIQKLNKEQAILLGAEDMSAEEFDVIVDKKSDCIERLNKLDEGFESLYERVAKELSGNKGRYAAQIKNMQGLIQKILDKSMSIQAMERRNKDAVERYFKTKRSDLGINRRSSKAAYDYYRNMNGSNVIPPQFMDKKK